MEKDNSLGLDSLRERVENDHRFKSSYRGYDKKSVNDYISALEKERDNAIAELQSALDKSEQKAQEMKADFQQWQREVRIAREQKKIALDNLKAEYEKKMALALEENTKTINASNQENSVRMKAVLDEKEQKFQLLKNQYNKKLRELVATKDKEKDDAVFTKSQEMQEIIDQKEREISILNDKLANREAAEKKLEESTVASYKAENARLTDENNKRKLRIVELEEELAHLSGNLENSVKSLDSLNEQLNEMIAAKFAECEDIVSVWSKQYDSISRGIKERLQENEN